MSTRLVTFTLAERSYGIDVSVVQEVLRGLPCTRVPLAPRAVAGLVNLRGQVLTAVDLREQLGLPAREDGTEPMLVVTRVDGDDPVALVVDGIGSVVDVEPELFEPPPDTLLGPARELIVGVYKLADRLLLTLDVDKAVAA